ncbi:MAG: hypothetical protein E7580_07065 [Ruminococcaceae bacterium]|nr:hypothetical protein [Oscillospiraceae bacterium]
MKKLLALFLALMMVFSMVACSDSKGSDTEEDEGYSSAEDVAKAWLKAMAKGDADAYLDCTPDFMQDQMAQAYGLDEDYSRSQLKKAMEEEFDAEDAPELGSVKAKVSAEYDEDELGDMLAELAEEFDIEEKDITAAAEVTLEYEYEVDGDKRDGEEDCTCIEYNGSWFVLRD